MSDTGSWLLIILLYITLPCILLMLPFFWYAKRHGQNPQQYGIPMLWLVLGWTVVALVWVFKAQIDVALKYAVEVGVFSTLCILGIRQVFRPRTPR